MPTAQRTIPQAAAVPLRAGRVCVVTSRSGKRWVVPKGCLEPGKTAEEIALQEAWEEAGLLGVLAPVPLGTYDYEKYGRTYCVTVFLMHVHGEGDRWPERRRRRKAWLPLAKALDRLGHAKLRGLIRRTAI
jgi:8-oxo-dGTP pyrophosphatase MutT (NUDIX family)